MSDWLNWHLGQMRWNERAHALAAATGTAKTAKRVEAEGSQSGGSDSERNAQGGHQ